MPSRRSSAPYRIRRSPIHGTGVFATRAIRKGARVGEYVGRHISNEEADRLYGEKASTNSHTFLFTLDDETVVDANVDGNSLRYINHSCAPNCIAFIEDGHIYIEATKAIPSGAELLYDYRIGRDPNDPPNVEEVYACRCGAARCRGTMLEPQPKARTKASRRRSK